MLCASGELDDRQGGPYVATERTGTGDVVVDEKSAEATRRSVYLQQRRTQTDSLLEVFDAPSIVTTCTRRSPSTIPLQSLSLLNSDFVIRRARRLAERLDRDGTCSHRQLWRSRIPDHEGLSAGLNRAPEPDERAAARRFLEAQRERLHRTPARLRTRQSTAGRISARCFSPAMPSSTSIELRA